MASTEFLIISVAILSVGYYLFSLLYPKVLPGIPHRVESAKKIFGDIAEIKRAGARTREPSLGMFELARELGTPICQILIASFTNPLIVVNDPREAEDIILRRNREFDRSPLSTQLFKQVLPHATISQLTTPALKAQKRLWSDVMGADFLRRVVAPNVHLSAIELIDWWKIKAARAGGQPIEVTKDFSLAALDVIWVAVLGSKLNAVRMEIEELESSSGKKRDPEYLQKLRSATVMREAMEYVNEVVDAGMKSLFPSITFFFMRLTSTYRRAKKVRDDEIRRLMTQACKRFEALGEKGEGEEHDTCSMDLVLRREIVTAKRKGEVAPDPTKDPAMLEELLLLLLAGHDSTANTLQWFVKIMAVYQDAQAALRRALQAGFANSKCPESAAAILDADIPYLDASIEETIRVAGTAGIIARLVLVDTEILGCRIPKGSNVLLNTRITYPPQKVAEELRSPTSQAANTKRPRGGLDGDSGRDLNVYEPRRWMTTDENGKEVFDAYALPSLGFGGGLRGCFGKRLAMQELKIIIVHLILNFEFLPLPEDLTGMEAIERVFRQPKTCHVKLNAL